MKIGIPKEILPGEKRVATTPKTARRLSKQGFTVLVESGAGIEASFTDDAYREAGCEVIDNVADLYAQSDIIAKVRPPAYHEAAGCEEVQLLKEGATLISFIWPAENESLVQMLKEQKANAIAMDAIPRISRAQKLDALSSMSNISGYRAVIEAANNFGRFFTGQITAAGKVPPAKVLVIGAGVAGLASIGAANAMGAIVRAFDTRPAVKEQVESMGAEFLEVEFEEDGDGGGGYAKVMSPEFIAAEMDLFAEQAEDIDIVITTALIPGRPAPKLWLMRHVDLMKPGSVIVDLAAERGGNCEATVPNEVAHHNGVTIVGLTDLPSRMASVASELYGNNIAHLLDDMGKAEAYKIDLEDEVVRGALITLEGEVMWPPPKPDKPTVQDGGAKKEAPKEAPPPLKEPEKKQSNPMWLVLAGLMLLGIGLKAPESFLTHFTVFVLAIFVGYQIIWNVSAALHTPLMSVTNAISGIIIIGGMLQVSGAEVGAPAILGAAAIFVATINIAGGFLVTHRMLNMFRK